MNENVVKRLHDAADRFTADGLVVTAHLMREAADEIEYLRDRCEAIDNEWRLYRLSRKSFCARQAEEQ